MNSTTDAIARDVAIYASTLADKTTLARCKSGTAEQRQEAAAHAMMALSLLEEIAPEFRRLMPRSAEEGSERRKDLLEVGR